MLCRRALCPRSKRSAAMGGRRCCIASSRRSLSRISQSDRAVMVKRRWYARTSSKPPHAAHAIAGLVSSNSLCHDNGAQVCRVDHLEGPKADSLRPLLDTPVLPESVALIGALVYSSHVQGCFISVHVLERQVSEFLEHVYPDVRDRAVHPIRRHEEHQKPCDFSSSTHGGSLPITFPMAAAQIVACRNVAPDEELEKEQAECAAEEYEISSASTAEPDGGGSVRECESSSDGSEDDQDACCDLNELARV